MKCVKKGGTIQRGADGKASAMVKNGWQYTNKSSYKSQQWNKKEVSDGEGR